MANAAIGALQFIGDKTPMVYAISTKLRSIEREGVDGEELVNIGKRGQPVMWSTFQDVNSGAVTSTVNAMAALDGTLATVMNVDGGTVDNVRVELIGAPEARKVVKMLGGLTGGTGVWTVMAQWKLTPTV